MRRVMEVPAGTRFGRLVVVGETEPAMQPSGKRPRRMACRCDCGGTAIVGLTNLRSGHTTSCGCYMSEKTAASNTTHGKTVGGSLPKNYRIWANIKSRAVTGSHPSRKNYLDRGITIYKPWEKDFMAFDAWLNRYLGPCPKGQSLDRVDNDRGYEPGNLKWSTPPQQNNNRSDNVWVDYDEQTNTIAQWAEQLELSYSTLRNRLFRLNWPVEKALTTPARRKQRES
jgi:hypothetical protein